MNDTSNYETWDQLSDRQRRMLRETADRREAERVAKPSELHTSITATVSKSSEMVYYHDGTAYVTATKDDAIAGLINRIEFYKKQAALDSDAAQAAAYTIKESLALNERLRCRVLELEQALARRPKTFKHIKEIV